MFIELPVKPHANMLINIKAIRTVQEITHPYTLGDYPEPAFSHTEITLTSGKLIQTDVRMAQIQEMIRTAPEQGQARFERFIEAN